eukprot:3728860-Alexandrium_andersonii.AAC.1
MSASLVGSEMCIRDSNCAHAREHAHAQPRKPRNPGAGVAARSTALLPPCLLYTSDAADDM